MTTATEFLLGSPDTRGRTVETILAAHDAWLEDCHDWVQWAFPNEEPSAFNDEAPVWDPDEAQSLPPDALRNLKRLLARYQVFLSNMSCWRSRSNHNHARITRVLLCLRYAGLHEEARAFLLFVEAAPEPGEFSRSFWRDALEPYDDTSSTG